MRSLLLVSIACVLVACYGVADTGAVDASAGTGGAGGSGGSGGVDAAFDANAGPVTCGDDAGTAHSLRTGWFAERTTLDVWWQGMAMRDPGRDAVKVITLSQVRSAANRDEVTIKICGVTFPPYTSDVRCEAHQMTIDDATWDRPNMPRFSFDPRAQSDTVAALIGIDLLDEQELGAWPTAVQTGSFECEAGIGRACFPDHDGDNSPGVTARFRRDQATYVGPYDTGECTAPRPYIFSGPPTGFYCLAGSCPSNALVAAEHQLGLRLPLRVGDGCGVGDTLGVELRSLGCVIDPSGLIVDDPYEDRDETMDYTCRDAESQFIDDTIPQYRVLAAGEAPGASMPPLGWVMKGRDIDNRVSEGTRTTSVRLSNNPDSNEPTCAEVRAAFAND